MRAAADVWNTLRRRCAASDSHTYASSGTCTTPSPPSRSCCPSNSGTAKGVGADGGGYPPSPTALGGGRDGGGVRLVWKTARARSVAAGHSWSSTKLAGGTSRFRLGWRTLLWCMRVVCETNTRGQNKQSQESPVPRQGGGGSSCCMSTQTSHSTPRDARRAKWGKHCDGAGEDCSQS